MTLPSILPNELTPKVRAHRYLPLQIDLFFQEFMKSPESTWEPFRTPRGPPGGPQGTPRRPPRGPPRAAKHRTHIKLTSNSHQAHIKLTSSQQSVNTSNSVQDASSRPSQQATQGTTQGTTQKAKTYIHIFYREWNSRYLASGDRMLPYNSS